MLRYFFDNQEVERDSEALFEGLSINKSPYFERHFANHNPNAPIAVTTIPFHSGKRLRLAIELGGFTQETILDQQRFPKTAGRNLQRSRFDAPKLADPLTK